MKEYEQFLKKLSSAGIDGATAGKALADCLRLAPPICPFLFDMREELYPGEDWSKEKEAAQVRWDEYIKKHHNGE